MDDWVDNNWIRRQNRRDYIQLKRINRIECLLAEADKPARKRRKRKQRPHLFERQNHRCAYCGRQAKLTIDHVISLSMGGEDSVDNMVGACENCNKLKGSIDGYTFYSLLHREPDLANKLDLLFKTQPWVRSNMPAIAKYALTLQF